MKFEYTILYVKDVKKTITFYHGAFGFEQKFITPENDYAELKTGDTTISFASFELGNSNFNSGFLKVLSTDKPFGVELVFVTENIEIDLKRAIDFGATEYEPITQKPWGQKVCYVRDNNGFLIEICTPVESSPPQGPIDLGETIAERELKYILEGTEHTLTVKLGKPRPDQKPGGDWECAFQIGDKTKLAYGVDSLQALILAQQLLSANINYLNKTKKFNLTWLGMDNLGI